MTLGDLLDRAAERWGACPAVHDRWGTMCYSELLAAAERLAAGLRAFGVAPQAGLGLALSDDRRFLIGLCAGLKAGAVVLPMPRTLRPAESRQFLSQSGVHFVIDDLPQPPAGYRAATRLEAAGLPLRLGRTAAIGPEAIASHVAGAALVRFTSGTTGEAKGVVLSQRSVLDRLEVTSRALRLGPEDAVAWVLPMAFHFVASIMLYLYCGAAVVVAAGPDPGAIAECAARHRATLLYASPVHIGMFAAHGGEIRLPTLTRVICTTAGVSVETCRRFTARFGLDVCQAFGVFEVGLPILNLQHAARRPEAIGLPIEGFSAEVFDADMNAVAAGRAGRLGVRGPGMFDGYLAPPVLLDEVLRDGWFLSGDLAAKDPDGLFRIEGREKSAINVAGTKVFPEEVEQVLMQHPAVAACRVRGRAQELVGEYVVADVQLRPGKSAAAAQLGAWCRRRLSAHKVPRHFDFVAVIPHTASGKVIRD